MLRTRVGYTGGDKQKPTYRAMGNHTEAFQVDFDPTVIRYEALCQLFWRSHEPCAQAWSTQYRAALWYHDDDQRAIAEKTLAERASRAPREIHTAIESLGTFWLAEDYHQKYRLRHDEKLVDLLEAAIGPDAVLSSRSATKINAFKSRTCKLDAVKVALEAEVDDPEQIETILRHLRG